MKEYTLIRCARKTLSLEVGKDLRPLVRAPRRLPREEIDRFVGQKREWLRRATEQKRRQLAADAAGPRPGRAARSHSVLFPNHGAASRAHFHHIRQNPVRKLFGRRKALLFLAADALSPRGGGLCSGS